MPDLSSRFILEERTIDVIDPITREPMVDDEGNKMYVKVSSQYSKNYRKSNFDGRRKIMQQFEDLEPFTASDELAVELIASCIVDWHIQYDGRILKNSLADKRILLNDDRLWWLRRQIDEAIHEEAPFMQGSSES